MGKKFPLFQNEVLSNPYHIGDIIEVRDTQTNDWIESTVIDKENNWIFVHYNGWSDKYDQKIHTVKDRNRLRSKPFIPLFQSHMTLKRAMELKVDDKIDHRDHFGRFLDAIIVEKQGTNLKIHYIGLLSIWDVWSDYNKELHRFAESKSISKRAAHRFTDLELGGYIDINPKHQHCGWKQGEIRNMEKESGQIQIVYEYAATNYLYWAHLDDEEEIAVFLSNSLDANIQNQIINDAQDEDVKNQEEENKNENEILLTHLINAMSLNDLATPFPSHLTLNQANKLKVNDKIDHRDRVGRFVFGTIIDKQGSNLKIHHDGWSKKWDEWCDYTKELHRVAAAGSISKRPAHRFKNLKKKDYVDVNPLRHPGWKCGEIRRLDEKSGQVQVVYECAEKNYLYWVHLDNANEIAEFPTMSGLNHSYPNQQQLLDELNAQDEDVKNEEEEEEKKNEEEILLTHLIDKECKSERINAMSLNELSSLKNLLKDKIKLIENAEQSLMDNTLNCIACMDNKKNISFSDGCYHVALCDECEKVMERKCCPICNAPYSKVKKLAL